MIAIAWYLLKVIICSGILCGYYFLVLRNKVFHRWNRFFLLASVVVALAIPLMKIDVFQNVPTDKTAVIQMLKTISYGDEIVIEYSRNSAFQVNFVSLAGLGYAFMCAMLLLIFFKGIFKIARLKKRFPETKIKGISFIATDAKGTPFSFFDSIFWNNAIDLHSRSGQQIFNHEIAHVKEKHSYDKMFMNVVLIFFWVNPFFWLMRKELNMIHEFIADQQALKDDDLGAFAEMILQTVYPGQNFSLVNSFFYSPIKRRIMMLTKNKNPKVSYLSRLLVLPLAAIVFFAFTLKVKNNKSDKMTYNGKIITVVLDAGHGGDDHGALSSNGLLEKDLTLSIVKKVAALNSNNRIKIVLTRDNDKTFMIKDRNLFVKEKNPDMLISVHMQATRDVTEKGGISVFIEGNNIEKNNKNITLASALIQQLKKTYTTEEKIGTRQIGSWLLRASSCPAAIVECGYITNEKDATFFSSSANQEKIAENILSAIDNFASSLQSNNSDLNNSNPKVAALDTIPQMYYKKKKVRNLQWNQSDVKVTYTDGSKETITKKEADKRGFKFPEPPAPPAPPAAPAPPANVNPPAPPAPPTPPNPPAFPQNALYVVDGKTTSLEDVKAMNSSDFQDVHVLKGEKAVARYGAKGKNGVIEISTKNGDKRSVVTISSPKDPLYVVNGEELSKDEIKNIPPNSIRSVDVLKGESATKKYGEKGKDGVVEINTKSNNDTIPDKVFTKVENEASFPGGPQAWVKYITGKIRDSISTLGEKDFGTCVVKFIVNTDGMVSDVKATTMKGTNLAKLSVAAIKNGPKWIPATQADRTVAAYRLQPVTLTDPDRKK